MEPSLRRFPRLPIFMELSIPSLFHTVFLLCLFPLKSIAQQEIVYRMTEEEAIGYRVGNLVLDLNLEVDADTRFQFIEEKLPNETFFTVDEETGELTTFQRIDRENQFLCPLVEPVCSYELQILVLPLTAYRLINVHIEILDKNDHTPTFKDDIMVIEVPESVSIGTRIPMENAKDLDIGNNSIQNYYLSKDYDGTFDLVQTRNIDGSFSIQLEITGPLDREAKDHYDLLLLAVDGVPQDHTGSTRLNVTVLDSDDHRPTFARSDYTVNIAENLEIGTEILQVRAQDPDLGTNGQIIYGFSGSVSAFDIEADTGKIRTKTRIDYESQQSFQLIVKCTNNVPNPVPDFATVLIEIIDVNDNRPTLTVNSLEGSNNWVHLPETAEPGTLIAFIRVSDPDSGSSGEVRLLLSGHYDDFELQTVTANQYFLATKHELDREELAVYNITIVAEDKGDPILWRQKKFAIFVDDINDNAPFFSRRVYYETITENNAPGQPLTTVIATDDDEGENATVTYSLPGPQHGFAIDPQTGELVATSVLDREISSSIAITVAACDKGTPRLCGNVTVMVTILDENDNHPQFLLGTYELSVYENQDEDTLVGEVKASDNDIGDNSHVTYSIKTESVVDYFRINDQTGEIFTKIKLDREDRASYAMIVTATDSGGILAQKSSSVTVLISVLDRNDNPPKIRYPNPQDDAVFIPLSAAPGFAVAQVDAEDADDGPNARLSYGILDGNLYDIFGMKKNGQLVTSRVLRPQWADTVHFLNLRVTDSGSSSLETTAQIVVVIANRNFNESIPEDNFFFIYNMTVDTFLKNEANAGQNQSVSSKWPIVAVIALGSVAFVLLMIFLIVATKCRDKNKNRENQYAAPTTNTTDDMSTGSKPPSERKTSGTNSTNISLATSQSSIPSKNIQKWKSAEKNGSVDSRLGNKQMTTFGSSSDDVHSDSMQSLHSNSNRRTPDPDAEVQKLLNKLRHQEGVDATDDFSHSSCDSGHGDSDRDTRESNGTSSMSPDMNDLQNGKSGSYVRLAPLAQISGRSLMNAGERERGSYAASSLCTPECRTLGHSDLCWSQNTINGRQKADSYSSASSSRTLPSAARIARHQEMGDPRLLRSKDGAMRDSPSHRESPTHLTVPSGRMGAHVTAASPNQNQSNTRNSPSKNDDRRGGGGAGGSSGSGGGGGGGGGGGSGASTPGQQPLTPISEHPSEDHSFDHRGKRTHKGDKNSRGRGMKPQNHGRVNNNFQPDYHSQRTPTTVTFKDDRTSSSPVPNVSYSNRGNHRHAPSPLTNNIRNNIQHGMIVEASGYGSHSSVSSESSSEVNSAAGYSLDDLDGVLERCDIPATDARINMDKADQVPFTDWV